MTDTNEMRRRAFDLWRLFDNAEHDADIVRAIEEQLLSAYAFGFNHGYDTGLDDAEEFQMEELKQAAAAFGALDQMDNSDVLGPAGPNSFVALGVS